jgi:hypothetical protein
MLGRPPPPPRSPAAVLAPFLLAVVCLSACTGGSGADPCAGVDCSGHGVCVSDGVWPLCSCEPGFRAAGASCVSDGDGGDVDPEADVGADGPDGAEGTGDDGGFDPDGACDPAGAPRCAGDVLYTCASDGSGWQTAPCVLGCDDEGSACNRVDVPNVADDDLLASGWGTLTPTVDAGPYVVLDGSTGAITVHQADGTPVDELRGAVVGLDLVSGIRFDRLEPIGETPGLAVFAFASIVVPAGVTAVGVGDFPLALLSAGDVVVDGTLTVSAGGRPWAAQGPGPGGGEGGQVAPALAGRGSGGGAAGSQNPTLPTVDTGGGGAGYGAGGGSGGQVGGFAGGAGGSTYGEPRLRPLLGGSGGGGGGDEAGQGGAGGAGAGGLELVSGTAIRIAGAIVANGGGGRGGRGRSSLQIGPGGGGGSGGSILLVAPSVALTGVVAANGGGGGGGAGTRSFVFESGEPGEDGRPDALPAAGGEGAVGPNDGGPGGAGAAPAGVAAPNVASGDATDSGGGGGAAGRIRVETRTPTWDPDTAVVSPDASSGLFTVADVPIR